ncbi:hypothetical protein ANCDUO_23229, partial [Ancylostoma duodenale]
MKNGTRPETLTADPFLALFVEDEQGTMHARNDSLLLPATPNDPPDRLSEQQKTRSYIGPVEEKPLVLSMLLAWISPLFLIASAVPEESSFTLNDLVQPHTYQRLFDTLSASVASEYEGKVISFDESKVIEYDAPTFSIKKLNEKYSAIRVGHGDSSGTLEGDRRELHRHEERKKDQKTQGIRRLHVSKDNLDKWSTIFHPPFC